jgi:hypothetical protein
VSGITVPQFPDTTTKSKVTTSTIQANQSQMNDINSKESHDSFGALLFTHSHSNNYLLDFRKRIEQAKMPRLPAGQQIMLNYQ